MKLLLYILPVVFMSIMSAKAMNSESIPPQKSGKELFKRCSSCHGVNTTKAGPPFQKIREVRGNEWVYQFMKNPAYWVTRDEMSRRMLKKFGSIMPSYQLTRAEIDAICDYVDSFPYDPNSKDYDYRKK